MESTILLIYIHNNQQNCLCQQNCCFIFPLCPLYYERFFKKGEQAAVKKCKRLFLVAGDGRNPSGVFVLSLWIQECFQCLAAYKVCQRETPAAEGPARQIHAIVESTIIVANWPLGPASWQWWLEFSSCPIKNLVSVSDSVLHFFGRNRCFPTEQIGRKYQNKKGERGLKPWFMFNPHSGRSFCCMSHRLCSWPPRTVGWNVGVMFFGLLLLLRVRTYVLLSSLT